MGALGAKRSAIEDVIVDRGELALAPARRNAARMEIERAFRLAVPAILHRDLGDGDGLAPAFAAQADRRHAVAAHEAELAGLIDDAAQAVGAAAGAGAEIGRASCRERV